jgi:Fuc2NAc and GlcNAc transferase
MLDWVIVAGAFALSMVLTGVAHGYAVRQSMLDIPGPRSSHRVPTPRGGGISLVAVFLVVTALLFATGRVPYADFMAVFGGGLLVALVGFRDDHGHISAGVRILFHFSSVAWALYWAGGLPPVPLGNTTLELGWPGHILAAIVLVWSINLYNFMDGIDGIASIEAICVAGGAALIMLADGRKDFALWLGVMAAGAAGFLVWNWPPARIFMGDAGSGFLGFTLGVFAILTGVSGALPVWTWVILFGVFLVDASLTVLRRILAGARWYEAHRSHAYQRAARRWGSHKKVSLSVLVINVIWLEPLAWYAARHAGQGPAVAAVALTPLLVLAWALGAGREDAT